jgi:tetratricopeptide (TPR) repeat protein
MRRAFHAVAVLLLVVAGHAHAQSGDSSAMAEQLFKEARELAKANRWAEACPKFEASFKYDPVLGTRLNLAACYEHIGKLASAWGLYRESIDLARKAGDTKRRDYAQKQATALEPRLPRLVITAPTRSPAGLVVKRDGTTIEAGALGVALYIDPGPHEITASAPGFESFAQTVALAESKTETVALPDLKPQPAPVVAARPATPATADHDANSSAAASGPAAVAATGAPVAPRGRKYLAIGLGAAGIAAVGAGLAFGAKARSRFHDAQALCGHDVACDPASYDAGKRLTSDASSAATISTVLVAAGGAAIAAGVIVLITAPRTSETATARLVPVAHDRGAGLAVVGRF